MHTSIQSNTSTQVLQGHALIVTTRHLPGRAGVATAKDWALKKEE